MKKEMFFLLPYLKENGNKVIEDNNPDFLNYLFGRIDTKKNAQLVVFTDENECFIEMYVEGAEKNVDTMKALHANVAQNAHASYVSHEVIYKEKDFLKKKHWLKIKYNFNK